MPGLPNTALYCATQLRPRRKYNAVLGAPALGGTETALAAASFNTAASLLILGREVPGLPQHGVVLRHAAAERGVIQRCVVVPWRRVGK